MPKRRKYNKETKCYKIDLYYFDAYQYSTDHYKTCREARLKFIEKQAPLIPKQVVARFDRD